jgi:protein-L-isoaspartate(D-aspartate) O-methyltransferase
MLARMDLDTQRQVYAEEIRAVANLQSEVLVQAFAKVPREYFLGPGPWQIVVPSEPGSFSYRTTDDADPRHLYHNVLVAIDAERRLNNGQPSGLALWFDALDLQKGDRVSTSDARPVTILQSWAEVVGPTGRVTAIEVDPGACVPCRKQPELLSSRAGTRR